MGINEQKKIEDSSQEVLNKSVDPKFGVLTTEGLGYDKVNDSLRRLNANPSGTLLVDGKSEYTVKLEVDSVHNDRYYIGIAEAGTLSSDSLWQIKRLIKTDTYLYIDWADGDILFDNEWDNRESLTYA